MSALKPKILVCFYSTYGTLYKLSQEIARGAKSAGAEVTIKRFEEVLSQDILTKMKAVEPAKLWIEVASVKPEELRSYDGFLFGTPTRFGMMAC